MSISLKGLSATRVESTSNEHPATHDLSRIGKALTSVFLVALLLTGAAIGGLLLYGVSHANQIYEGVSLGGVDVSGMSRSAARIAVSDKFSTAANSPILLESNDKQFYFAPATSGIVVDTEASLDAAFDFGRSGSIWSRSQQWAGALLHGHRVPMQLDLDIEKIDATLQGAADQLVRSPQSAYLTYDETGAATIVPELPGISFDTEATRQAIITEVRKHSGKPVALITSVQQADTVTEDLENGLAQIQQVMDAPLEVTGLNSSWTLAPERMQTLLSYKKGDSGITIDAPGVEAFVEEIAKSVDQPALDAGITVDENGKLAAQPGQLGITVDRSSMSASIIDALENKTRQVDLVYSTTPPEITDDVATAAAARGEKLLDHGVKITWDGGSVTLDRGDLLQALTVRIREGEDDPFVFGFDPAIFEQQLDQTFKNISVPVKEPHLRLVDGKIIPYQKGESGKAVDVDASVAAIVDAATSGTGSAKLIIKTTQPTLSMPGAIDKIYLGDILAESSTYYGDSSDARRNNVEVAANLQDGWLIAPGQQFSYAEFVGGVTKDQGFVTGFGIVEDGAGGVTTAPVIGGGICQVSTTIFQAAFWSGLQIDERYSHPYWIQTYGEPPRGMKGLDAMVNIDEVFGTLDLKFTNTTGNWIAVQVFDDGTVLTARILGTDPGWTVDVSQPEISNIVKPDTSTRYTDTPELPEGTKLQVEYAQEGFTATIHRTVTDRSGKTLADGDLVGTYGASENTILVGTGAATPESDE